MEAPVDPLGGVGEGDPGPWVPATQLTRSQRVVGEQEILDGVRYLTADPLPMGQGQLVDPFGMRLLPLAPLGAGEHGVLCRGHRHVDRQTSQLPGIDKSWPGARRSAIARMAAASVARVSSDARIT